MLRGRRIRQHVKAVRKPSWRDGFRERRRLLWACALIFALFMALSVLTSAMHRLELLLLVGGENRLDLAHRAFMNPLHLRASILLRQRRILAHGLHLLHGIFKDRFNFGFLVVSKIERL